MILRILEAISALGLYGFAVAAYLDHALFHAALAAVSGGVVTANLVIDLAERSRL